VSVAGTIRYTDGTSDAIEPETLTRMPEAALRLLAAATVALALALLVLRAT
jgi:hypothetical protein